MGYTVNQFNTAQPLAFLMVLSSDHITGATGVTPVVQISKAGGAFITPSGAISEMASGWYKVAANEFDANTIGPLLLHATATGCDPRDDTFTVVNYNPLSVFPVSPPAPATFGLQSAEDYINRAFDDLGVKAAGETTQSFDMNDALRRLNNMISSWGVQPDTMPVTAREVFSLTANQQVYTIGPGGDFDTVRPIFLTGAALLLNTSSPPIEIPVGILTDDAFQSIQLKDYGSLYPTQIYYNATFTDGLGRIQFWPIPTTGVNDFVLYTRQALIGFASLTAKYTFPPGYDEAIEYNLAIRLARPYALSVPPEILQLAHQSLRVIKRANTPLNDLGVGPEFARNRRAGYNILTGQGG